MIRNGSVINSIHTDNIEKQLNFCTYLHMLMVLSFACLPYCVTRSGLSGFCTKNTEPDAASFTLRSLVRSSGSWIVLPT